MKTFRDEGTGERWQHYAPHYDGRGRIIIEPLPKPPQTEAEILMEMEKAIAAEGFYDAERMCRVARATVAATLKIVEGKK